MYYLFATTLLGFWTPADISLIIFHSSLFLELRLSLTIFPFFFFLNFLNFLFFLFYNIVLVLPYININFIFKLK